jgi:hypothetical protein
MTLCISALVDSRPVYVEKCTSASVQINFQISAALHHPVNGHREGAIFRAYHGTKRRSNLVSKTNVLLGGPLPHLRRGGLTVCGEVE